MIRGPSHAATTKIGCAASLTHSNFNVALAVNDAEIVSPMMNKVACYFALLCSFLSITLTHRLAKDYQP